MSFHPGLIAGVPRPYVAPPQAPAPAPVSMINFEQGQVPKNFVPDASGGKITTAVADAAAGLTRALEFRDIGNGQTAYYEFTADVPPGGDTLTVRYRTSSEANFDLFRVLVDGVVKFTDSGNPGVFEEASIPLVEGLRTIRLRYSKDASGDQGSDTTFISRISTAAPILAVGGYALTRRIDFEGGTIPAELVFDASGAVVEDKADPDAGLTKALRFRPISAGQSTYLDLQVNVPGSSGNVRVRYFVSSEASDFFRIRVDGVQVHRDSGLPGVFKDVTVVALAGPHTIRLEYAKDATINTGSDTVWISSIWVDE